MPYAILILLIIALLIWDAVRVENGIQNDVREKETHGD